MKTRYIGRQSPRSGEKCEFYPRLRVRVLVLKIHVDQVQLRERIITLAHFTRRLYHNHFQRWPDVRFQKIPSMGSPVRLSNDYVSVDLRRAPIERDVAD